VHVTIGWEEAGMTAPVTGPLDGWSDGARSHVPTWPPSTGRRATAEAEVLPLLQSVPAVAGPAQTAPVHADRLYAAGWLHNLPQPLTSFVGRKKEIVDVSRLLASARLVTLTGTCGVGKTRLGHEVAARVLDAFHGGVWVVDLAALTDPDLVPQSIASVLDVREEPDRSLTASVAAVLRGERLLLVLDNCEHLIEACASIADVLLRACPDLTILATSRQALGIAGETTFSVPSLSLASCWDNLVTTSAGTAEPRELDAWAPSALGMIERSAPSEAVQLFVERAQAAVPAFALTARNVSAIEKICQRLDGIPLAIELAAARVAVLSPDQIEARLDDRFRLLSGGSRTALPRYRTLRALIDWSHDLLDEQERTVLRRLAVFSGGWTLEAAESVCAGDGVEPDEILDLLSGLVAKSLVFTSEGPDDEVRYGFLEFLREYAVEKLRDAGEETALRERHCSWYLAFAEQAEPRLSGSQSELWLDCLERERENLRAVLAWCVDRGDAETGLRLSGALARFWLVRGPYRETRGTLTELLALPQAQATSASSLSARTKALFTVGRLDMRQDDSAAAESRYQEALTASRELGDRRGEAIALFSIGHVARVRGEYEAARRRFEESRQVFAALGDRYWLGQIDHELGVAAFYEGDLTAARALYEAALAAYKALGDEWGIVAALDDLGEVAFLEGDLAQARALLRGSLEMARRIGDRERIAMVLVALAGMAVVEGQPTRALRLASAATGLNDVAGLHRSPAWHVMVEQWLAPAYEAMSPDDVAAVQAAGQVMSLDDAVEYALSSDVPASDLAAADGSTCEAVASAAPVTAPAAPEVQAIAAPIASTRAASGTASGVGRAASHGAGANGSSPGCTPSTCAVPNGVVPGRSVSARAERREPELPWRAVTELTQREQEVAALVARGMTNRQIANELVITEGTAANHVKHILARLVLDSRVQIATWAIEHGLTRPASA